MTHRTASVTVIMPVCNGERFVGEALDSLWVQTFRDFVVLAVDDASTDGTQDVLRACTDPRLRVVRNGQRLGPAGARNRGLELVDTQLVAFFDSDDIAERHKFDVQMTFIGRRPEVQMLGARVAVIDEQGHRTGAVWGYEGDERDLAATMLFTNGLATSTLVIRRDLVGAERFDATLAVASDYEMWQRLLHRGAAVSLPDLLVRYRIHPANLTQQRRELSEECHVRIARGQLARLGIQPSATEIDVHRRLGCLRPEGKAPFVAATSRWLDELAAANRTRRLYNTDAFGRVLQRYWLATCDAAAWGGCWDAWPTIARSPLTRQLLRDGTTGRSVARLPWRTLRGYVRRRWPCVGVAVHHLRGERHPRV